MSKTLSLSDKIDSSWSDISRKKAALNEALSWSVTGRNLQRSADEFAGCDAMVNIRKAFLDEHANTIDRFKMAQYLAMALECSPLENLLRFMEYLENISAKAKCDRRRAYYINVRNAVYGLYESKELGEYMAIYEAFLKDEHEKSTLARNVMQQISHSTQRLMGEYA